MRKLDHCHTQPQQGNIVERLKGTDKWQKHILTKEDIALKDEEPHIFLDLYRPIWINDVTLKLLKFELIFYKELNETCYYEEYTKHEKRKTFVLQIYYEEVFFKRRQEEKVSYKFFTGYDHLCRLHEQDLYLHDIQNLLEKYEND